MKKTLKIIDASVAIKWFVQKEDGKEEADALLQKIIQSPKEFAVPEFFFNEMLSVLSRIHKSEENLLTSLELLLDLGLDRVGNGRELLKEAAKFANQYNLSGYDAIYAATASLMHGKWITADLKAFRRIEALKIAEML